MKNNYLHKGIINSHIIEGLSWESTINKKIQICDSFDELLSEPDELFLDYDFEKGVLIENLFATTPSKNFYDYLFYLKPSDKFAYLNDVDFSDSRDYPYHSKSKLIAEFNKREKELQTLINTFRTTKNIQYYFLIKKLLQSEKRRLINSLFRVRKTVKFARQQLKKLTLYFILSHFSFSRNLMRRHIKCSYGDSEEGKNKCSRRRGALFKKIYNLNNYEKDRKGIHCGPIKRNY